MKCTQRFAVLEEIRNGRGFDLTSRIMISQQFSVIMRIFLSSAKTFGTDCDCDCEGTWC